MENSHDRQIDTVLQGLRHAEPDEALQSRVLAALQEEAPTRSVLTGSRRAPLLAAMQWATGPWLVAAALLLAASGTLLVRWQGRSTILGDPNASATDASGHVKDRFEALRGNEAVNDVWRTLERPRAGQRAPRVLQRHGLASIEVLQSHITDARHEVPLPGDDTRSFPAPQLPLTEQERLLLRLVRREPPTQLAQLSEAARGAIFERDKAHVTEYFAKPMPAVDPPDEQTSDTGQQ